MPAIVLSAAGVAGGGGDGAGAIGRSKDGDDDDDDVVFVGETQSIYNVDEKKWEVTKRPRRP